MPQAALHRPFACNLFGLEWPRAPSTPRTTLSINITCFTLCGIPGATEKSSFVVMLFRASPEHPYQPATGIKGELMIADASYLRSHFQDTPRPTPPPASDCLKFPRNGVAPGSQHAPHKSLKQQHMLYLVWDPRGHRKRLLCGDAVQCFTRASVTTCDWHQM